MTCQIHRASKKQKYDPNSGFLAPEPVPQTSTRAASPQSLVWPTHGTCLLQMHFLLPGTAPAHPRRVQCSCRVQGLASPGRKKILV